ncbi:catalase [Commensalibacter oyaizuii]|uniref:Catalase n=1 Tax=Commensalibacter oyaizuii TaxID=3043873 RepID=A0ABT6Q102_9PROT|nr:catalase [Commensalibacter sp. TBRC 16381]MDI2090773.1 catalase [Commensalibacter sp. TBRC 16381]
MSKKILTGANGAPVADNQNARTAGPRGPVLIDDFHLIEKLAHFNRENIPERRVHAKGAAAHGKFVVTKDITKYSCAKLFSQVGKETPIFARFSTVGGERGSADTVRDPRGFSLKFYTEEGNWDIVGNNTPVFFIRDSIKFPDFIRTQKRDPKSNLKDPNMMWDFWSHSPEALHQVTILFSDRGIPDGFRFMHGYGSHTYSLINKDGVRTWVKWHYRTQQGIKNLDPQKADELAGTNPDYATQDLFDAIEKGDFPKWGVYIQIMTEEQAKQYKENPFDVTKVWSQKEFPLHEVGYFELNRNPENYFAEVEQAAFAPSNVIPGTGLSPDKMLQGRVFAYADAQRYRVGTNYQLLPINAPKCPYANYQRDGAMRFDSNGGGSLNYEPNSDETTPKQTNLREPYFPADLSGPAGIYDHREDGDYYSQPAALFNLMTPEQKQLLIDNIVGSMQDVKTDVVKRMIEHFTKIHPDYGQGIAKGLKLK